MICKIHRILVIFLILPIRHPPPPIASLGFVIGNWSLAVNDWQFGICELGFVIWDLSFVIGNLSLKT